MAGLRQTRVQSGQLVALIGDEDTITGFLLAGVGDASPRLGTNYLLVDDGTFPSRVGV